MKNPSLFFVVLLVLLGQMLGYSKQYDSAVYMNPNIIVEQDISVYNTVTFIEWETYEIYDRRVSEYLLAELAIYQVSWQNGKAIEIQVHKEIFEDLSSEFIMETYVSPFAFRIGQLPTFLLDGINRVVLIKGEERWSASLGSIYVHINDESKINPGFVEEVLIHEGGHAAIDEKFRNTPEWKLAQQKDSLALSKYASENLQNEDLTESIIFWLAIRYRNQRIESKDSIKIAEAMPYRLAFLDSLNFDVFPMDQPNDFDHIYKPENLLDPYDLTNALTFDELLTRVYIFLPVIIVFYLIRYVIRNA